MDGKVPEGQAVMVSLLEKAHKLSQVKTQRVPCIGRESASDVASVNLPEASSGALGPDLELDFNADPATKLQMGGLVDRGVRGRS